MNQQIIELKLQEILETIKFSLTIQQQEELKQKLNELFNEGIIKGYWSSGQGIE